MTKSFVSCALFNLALLNVSVFCSEKNWMKTKLNNFVNKTIKRHTYEYGSFEHVRDRALLFLLPSNTAQAVLTAQRSNLQKFLKENEENTRNKLIKLFGSKTLETDTIFKKFQEQYEFELSSLRKKITYKNNHDDNLPSEWINAIKKEADRYKINIENINLTAEDNIKDFAYTCSRRQSPENEYRACTIGLNTKTFKELKNILPHNHVMEVILSQTAMHELSHIMHGHKFKSLMLTDALFFNKINKKLSKRETRLTELETKQDQLEKLESSIEPNKAAIDTLLCEISSIKKYIVNKENKIEEILQNMDLFEASPEYVAHISAMEKTADTYIPCIDKKASENAYLSIKYERSAGYESYPDNHNDIKVIHANWQTSQAITNCQQLKNSIMQKLNVFPKFFA